MCGRRCARDPQDAPPADATRASIAEKGAEREMVLLPLSPCGKGGSPRSGETGEGSLSARESLASELPETDPSSGAIADAKHRRFQERRPKTAYATFFRKGEAKTA